MPGGRIPMNQTFAGGAIEEADGGVTVFSR
jgi:hypothetical protein